MLPGRGRRPARGSCASSRRQLSAVIGSFQPYRSLEDHPQPPGATRVADQRQIRQGFLDPPRGPRPASASRDTASSARRWAAGRVEVADDHVIEQDIVQPAGAEIAAHQMRVDVEHRHFGQCLFQFVRQDSIVGSSSNVFLSG